jgi:hypothetical protein
VPQSGRIGIHVADQSKDLLGLKPVGEALHAVTKAAVDGAASFLSRICLPAAEEFGLLLRDRVSAWRAHNLLAIAQKAEARYQEAFQSGRGRAHPRLVGATIEHGSWADSSEVQDMWAGLLVSSCTEGGDDEDNLIYVNILSELTTTEARLLNHACSKAEKRVVLGGLLVSEDLNASAADIRGVTGIMDMSRIDRELDHLSTLGLIHSAFKYLTTDSPSQEAVADIAPTALALNMFVRCQGSRQPPAEFFGLIGPHEP